MSAINISMKTANKKLTDKQYQVNQKQNSDTWETDKWLRSQGIDTKTFIDLHPIILQAQQQACLILKQHRHLLTPSQFQIILNFQKDYANSSRRQNLKPKDARAVLNISSKINRNQFKQFRQLPKVK